MISQSTPACRQRCLALLLAAGFVAQAKAQTGLGETRVNSQQLGDGLYVLFPENAGNMLVSIGENGVLMIDDAYPETVPAYRQAIAGLGGNADIDFVINTHWHFDHADGNKLLGAEGVWFVAHENSRDMMTQDNRIDVIREVFEQPAYPVEGWPVITYDDAMRMHFNGERIELLHVAPAHTAGDTVVIFPERNLVHMGDVYITVGYPFLDVDHGGSLKGMIEFCERVLDRLQPGAVVVPGHGPVSDYDRLLDYVLMLKTIRDRMSALIKSGATLEQVAAARLTAEWDDALGDPSNFLTWAYASLTDSR